VAGTYRKIIIEFVGTISAGTPAVGYLTMLMNGDTAVNYQFLGIDNNGALSSNSAVLTSVGFAAVGLFNNTNASEFSTAVEIYPVTAGAAITGNATSTSMWSTGVISGSHQFIVGFSWVGSNLTSLTFTLQTDSTFTGAVRVRGEL
jgi:hypothetical protein